VDSLRSGKAEMRAEGSLSAATTANRIPYNTLQTLARFCAFELSTTSSFRKRGGSTMFQQSRTSVTLWIAGIAMIVGLSYVLSAAGI
jgi:hypothetical protein